MITKMSKKILKICLFVLALFISEIMSKPTNVGSSIKINDDDNDVKSTVVKYRSVNPISIPTIVVLNDEEVTDQGSSSLTIDCSLPENRLFVTCALAIDCSLPENWGMSHCKHIAEEENVAFDGAIASEEDNDDDIEEMEEEEDDDL
ncbi:hypothetical protein H8356DRAFT_984311 [Neocallimastix lanati (nom. inval.)]|nr:hypothetical protein H8356DRAFT_984311 [Neocallimastix sp. JGI-2020a]